MNSLMDYSSTAILLFAQSEKKQSKSKPIAYQKKQTVLLWKELNERVLKVIQKTNIPYFIADENNQIGNTFGEKITQSIQVVFSKGFEKVIVVGNDCVELNSKHLFKAYAKLQTNDVVLGSDFNGGAYLIGVTRKSFKSDEFKTISWQTSYVLDELQLLFNKNTFALLPNLNDCNSTSDFKRVVHKLSFSDSIKHLLFSMLHIKRTIRKHLISFFEIEIIQVKHNKGSPFSI